MIPVLEDELKEKNKAIENILKAVEKGLGVEALLMRLEVLQNEKSNIELSLAKEKMETPLFTKEQFLRVLRNFSLIDIKNQDGQRKIIDTFINSIYAYEDYFKIVYNGTEKEEIVSLKEIQSSTLFSEGEPRKKHLRKQVLFSIQSEGLVCNRRAKCGAWNPSLCDGMAPRASVYLPSD